MSDETWAINYLRFWYNASNVSKFPSSAYISYPAFIAKMRDGTTFLVEFGKAVKNIRQDKIKDALEKLAAKNPNVIPTKYEFFQASVDSAAVVTFGEIAGAAADGVKDTAKIALFAGGSYVLIMGIAAVVVLAPALMEEFKAARHAA
jgi:hypothetical protein